MENKEELINKIKEKRELSQLPDKDLDLAFSKFEKQNLTEEEKFKKTRKVLHEVFGSVLSKKLFSPNVLKKRTINDMLKKHNSTSERINHYEEIYSRVFSVLRNNEDEKFSVMDLGAGINGLSYNYMKEYCNSYFGVESVKQVVDLINEYFFNRNLDEKKFRVVHESLFNLEKIKLLVRKSKKPRVIFLFKVVDALENLEKNYSKKLIHELSNEDVSGFVVSFPFRSVSKGRNFKAERKWFEDFLNEGGYKILDDFVLAGERFFVFSDFRKNE